MSQTSDEHRANSPRQIRCAVITISDTRTPETDTGGQTLIGLLESAGHRVVHRQLMKDEPAAISRSLLEFSADEQVEAILLTGGTGLSSRDQTFETVDGLLTKRMPGYGELFRTLSYQEIGAAAMLSRATGGLIGQTAVLTMPGSPAAVRLAMEKLILPELGHLVREAIR